MHPKQPTEWYLVKVVLDIFSVQVVFLFYKKFLMYIP